MPERARNVASCRAEEPRKMKFDILIYDYPAKSKSLAPSAGASVRLNGFPSIVPLIFGSLSLQLRPREAALASATGDKRNRLPQCLEPSASCDLPEWFSRPSASSSSSRRGGIELSCASTAAWIRSLACLSSNQIKVNHGKPLAPVREPLTGGIKALDLNFSEVRALVAALVGLAALLLFAVHYAYQE